MKYGYYSDNDLKTFEQYPFRCPSWDPMPDGKKNVVILGCSHTWGVGLEPDETWAHLVSQQNKSRLRYFNLGQPGASPETVVRILYSCEKPINPKIIIVMWPEASRRERLVHYPMNLHHTSEYLKHETDETGGNNECQFPSFCQNSMKIGQVHQVEHLSTSKTHNETKNLNLVPTRH